MSSCGGILALAVLAAGPVPEAAVRAGFDAADWSTMEEGKVATHLVREKIEGRSVAHGHTGVIVKAPAEACWKALLAYEKLPQFIPSLPKAVVLERKPGFMRVRAATAALFLTFEYGLLFQLDDATKLAVYTLDRGQKNDVREAKGAWRFVPLPDGRTLFRYELSVETGAPVPDAVEDYFSRRSFPAFAAAFRDGVEKRATQ